MELEQDLRLTSDDLMNYLERLRDLELEKRGLTPGSSEFVSIAAEIEKLAARVLATTVKQETLAEETLSAKVEDDVELRPIKDVPPVREVQLILAEWREAERRLAAASYGTPEHLQAQAAVKRLRDEYRSSSQALARDSDV